MSLQPLYQTLTGAIQNGSLALTGTLLQSPPLGSLITELYPDGTMTVGAAAVTLSQDQATVTVTGTMAVGSLSVVAVTIGFADDGSGTLQMTARLALGDCTLTDLFGVMDPALAGLKLSGAGFVLSSVPTADAGTGRNLDPGLNLTGGVDVVAQFPYLAVILPTKPVLALAGPVTDFANQLFDVTSVTTAGTLLGVALPDMAFEFAGRNALAGTPVPGSNSTAAGIATIAEVALLAGMTVGGVTGSVRAVLPMGGDSLTLNTTFQNLTLTSFADLAVFIGPVDPFSFLPAPIQQEITRIGNSFALVGLDLSVNLAKPAFVAVGLKMVVDLSGYAIFTPIPALSVRQLGLTFAVNMAQSTSVVTFGAAALIRIGGSYDVNLSFQTQTGGSYIIQVAQADDTKLSLTAVLQTFLPGLTGFPDLTVESFCLTLDPASGDYSFDALIAETDPWEAIPVPSVVLDSVEISARYSTTLTPATSGAIIGTFTLKTGDSTDDAVAITLSAVKDPGTQGWLLSGNTAPDEPIPVGELIDGIVHSFNATAALPAFLSGLMVENLQLSFATETKAFHFGTEISMPFSDEIVLDLTVALDVDPLGAGSTGYETTFTGTIQISQYRFDIVFDTKTQKGDTLIATYQPAGGSRQSVSLRELLAGISPSLAADVPDMIRIDLQDVKFVFTRKPGAPSQMAFGLDVCIPIDLTAIPGIGSHLPPELTLAVTNLQGVYATAPFTQGDTQAVNALLPSGVQRFPSAGLGQGVNLTADLRLGTWTEHFQLAGTPPGTGQPAQPPAGGGATPVSGPAAGASGGSPGTTPTKTAPPANAGDAAYKWINVNKQIGIFQFDRIGAGYVDNRLSLALDAGITLGPLDFSLIGLSVGSPMDAFAPVFGLNGLGLMFNKPPIKIGGGFMKVEDKTSTSYYGQVVVQVSKIGFSALGGWTPATATSPSSFFVYANVDIPLGGPPYLQLKAISGGIGINRSLILPSIDELPGYILLPKNAPPAEKTPQATVTAVLPQLEKYFIDEPGQYWMAAGIAFSSFEMIEAFALVTVSFGVDFELGILGSVSMSIPTDGVTPIAFVEADLLASFAPSSGLLAFEGVISPQSYVFGGFVKVQGGFAFCLWFDKEHAGDFVVTVGGYYPSFDKPAHYPAVPRIKLGFAVGPVSVSGGGYFALTPAMLMAGLSRNATFNAGPIKAWFDAAIDLLIAWAPFHYQAGSYVTIGVSVDLGLFTLKVQVGADLAVWGPEFGGKADVDLDVASFSFSFGAPASTPQPVGWSTVQTSFLPADSPVATPAPITPAPVTPMLRSVAPDSPTATARAMATTVAAPAPTGAEQTNILKVTVKTGLMTTAVPGSAAIISPNGFDIDIQSSIPANVLKWDITGTLTGQDNSVSLWKTAAPAQGKPFLTLPAGLETFSTTEVWNPALDMAPMKKVGITSTLDVSVRRHSDQDSQGVYSDPITDITVAPTLLPSNTALWKVQDISADPNLPALLPQTLIGVTLSPVPHDPDTVSDVPLIELLFAQGNTTAFYPGAAQVVPGYGVASALSTDHRTLTITLSGAHTASLPNQDYRLHALIDPWVAGQRSAAATALRAAGFATFAADEIDLTDMATKKALTDWPAVRQLGA